MPLLGIEQRRDMIDIAIVSLSASLDILILVFAFYCSYFVHVYFVIDVKNERPRSGPQFCARDR